MCCVEACWNVAPITTVLAQESSIIITKNEKLVSEADTPKGDIVVNLSNGEILVSGKSR